MKILSLDFGQRVSLMNVVGSARGDMARATSLYPVMRGLRFSDEEQRQIKVEDLGNGITQFVPPGPGFGRVEVELDEGSAAAVKQVLEEGRDYRPDDFVWLEAVKKQLNAPSVYHVDRRKKEKK